MTLMVKIISAQKFLFFLRFRKREEMPEATKVTRTGPRPYFTPQKNYIRINDLYIPFPVV